MKKQAKEKGNKKKKHIFLRVLLILILIIAIAGCVFAYKVHQNGGGMEGVIKTGLGYSEEKVQTLDKIYCLLLGQSQNLTDTIMLASYDPKTQEASLLSIPRDTFIGDDESKATAWDKINAVYQTGVDNLLEDVRNLTGINVQYYLKVDTEALKVLVDEIGGVYFDVPINMHYTDRGQGLYINLQAGYQKLDGHKAEQVVRFRHNSDGSTYPSEYGGEDLGRMRTQRAFLEAVLEQTIENMDINTIFSFLDIAEKYVETNLDFDVIKDYVPSVLDFNMDNLETATLPGTPEYIGQWAFYTVNEDEAEEVINKLFYGIEPQVEGNTVDENTIIEDGVIPDNSVKVEVLNGSGSESVLSEVISKLKSAGFSVVQTGIAKGATNTTVIDRGELTEAESNSIKEIMGIQNITSGESGEKADVTVIIGSDYEG